MIVDFMFFDCGGGSIVMSGMFTVWFSVPMLLTQSVICFTSLLMLKFLRSHISDYRRNSFFVWFAFPGRLDVSQVPELSQVVDENRLDLLYESHPAETQVDGLPRAASSKSLC